MILESESNLNKNDSQLEGTLKDDQKSVQKAFNYSKSNLSQIQLKSKESADHLHSTAVKKKIMKPRFFLPNYGENFNPYLNIPCTSINIHYLRNYMLDPLIDEIPDLSNCLVETEVNSFQ